MSQTTSPDLVTSGLHVGDGVAGFPVDAEDEPNGDSGLGVVIATGNSLTSTTAGISSSQDGSYLSLTRLPLRSGMRSNSSNSCTAFLQMRSNCVV